MKGIITWSFSLVLFIMLGHAQTVDLTSYLPANHSKRGDVDYTQHLQEGMDAHRKVKMPNFPILVNQKGLMVSSNTEILFDEHSKVIMAPSTKKKYAIFNIENIENVTIIKPNLKGDRYTRLKKTGEWGMGINILSSKNILIRDGFFKDFWGDGICIGQQGKGVPSSQIVLTGNRISNVRRNGISVGSAVNMRIEKNFITSSRLCGIDIEPSSNLATIDQILIVENRTENCRSGLQIALNKINGEIRKKINIDVRGHKDNGSEFGFTYGGFVKKKNNIVGQVSIRESVFENNKLDFDLRKRYQHGPLLKFR